MENKYQEWFDKYDDGKLDNKLNLAKYLWDEYKYRHEHCWNLTFKFTLSVVTLGIIPYIKSEKFAVPDLIIRIIPPLLSIALSLLGRKQLKRELEILDHIRSLYRPLQDTITIPFVNNKPSTFTRFILRYLLCLILAAMLNFILIIVIWVLQQFK
jgi:hypothetical protein